MNSDGVPRCEHSLALPGFFARREARRQDTFGLKFVYGSDRNDPASQNPLNDVP